MFHTFSTGFYKLCMVYEKVTVESQSQEYSKIQALLIVISAFLSSRPTRSWLQIKRYPGDHACSSNQK